jgi:anti-anti-sigma factor
MSQPLIYRPSGRLDATHCPEHEGAIRALLAAGQPNLTIDCAAVDFLSSAGLRLMLMAARELATRAGRLTLSNVRPNVYEILEISGVLTVITVAD